jgi:hypothetical protein
VAQPIEYRSAIPKARRRPPGYLIPVCRVCAVACVVSLTIEFLNGFDAELSRGFIATELSAGAVATILGGFTLARYRLTRAELPMILAAVVVGLLSIAAALFVPRLIHN